MNTPTTEAGRALLDWLPKPCGLAGTTHTHNGLCSSNAHALLATVEAEAARDALLALRAQVNGLRAGYKEEAFIYATDRVLDLIDKAVER